MASKISSTPDEIPQRKVPMDDVTIDAEMKKDLPEVHVAKNPSVMPVPKFYLPPKPMGYMAQNGRRAASAGHLPIVTNMNPELFKAFFWLKYDFIQQTNQEQYNPC